MSEKGLGTNGNSNHLWHLVLFGSMFVLPVDYTKEKRYGFELDIV